MKEILLCKYGELTLKGLNRGYFEKLLRRELEKRLKLAGNFTVTAVQSTIYVEPQDDDADIDEALRLCRKVFGITAVARAAEAEKRLKNFKALIRLKARRSPDIMGVKKKKQIRCHCEPVRTLVWQSPRKTGNSVRNDS